MPGFVHPSNDEQLEYVVINAFEDIVRENVLKMVASMKTCSCEKCISDICAIVLNQLPPSYVTTRKGALLTKVQTAQDNYIDLTVKVVHAIQLVKEVPRHQLSGPPD